MTCRVYRCHSAWPWATLPPVGVNTMPQRYGTALLGLLRMRSPLDPVTGPLGTYSPVYHAPRPHSAWRQTSTARCTGTARVGRNAPFHRLRLRVRVRATTLTAVAYHAEVTSVNLRHIT